MFGTYAQFDRMNADPVTKYPSFVGNSGKSRIAIGTPDLKTFGSFNNITNASFDFFSKKLKGGYGIALSEISLAESSYIYSDKKGDLTFAYSPKLTFKNNKQTWSPAIGFIVHHTFKTYYYRTDSSGHSKEISLPGRTSLSPYLGLAINTDKALIAYSSVFDREFKNFQNNVLISYQFDKTKSNKISSTLSNEFELNFKYEKPSNIFYLSPYLGGKRTSFKYRMFYDVSLGKGYISQGFQVSKSHYAIQIIGMPHAPFITSNRIGYKGKKLNIYLSKECFFVKDKASFWDGLKMGVIYTFNK